MAEIIENFWEDRRVKIGYETAEELAHKLNPFNFRGHPEGQADALDDSLDLLGWVGSVKVNIQTGRIFDGELRIKRSLAKDPALQVPVDYYDLTPDEELLALQIHDAITEQAQPIPEKLAALLQRTREMTADKPGLGAMLEALKARAGVNGLMTGNGNGNGTPQIIPEQFMILIECQSEFEQSDLLERLTGEGLQCKALIS
jgi:hypothetical protein